MTQTNVYSVNGDVAQKVDVPAVFSTPYRPDIIKKAVLAAAANGRQPYGPAKKAGMRHAVSTRGKGTGSARNQRVHGLGKASESPNNVSFPVVVSDAAQDLTTTAEVSAFLEKIGLGYDLDRAKDGRKIRAGRGTMRNRKYRTPVSVLIVVAEREVPIFKSAANLPGVQIEAVGNLSASILAPGGDAGRLVVYTESAFAKIGEW